MKYKIGDRVRIKSLDWYNDNKNNKGIIVCGSESFTHPMSYFCNKVVNIITIQDDCYRILEDDGDWYWTDEMIEGLAEEEKKPEFKVGDKITNGKTQLTILQITSDKYIVDDSFGECGTLYFNTQDDWKLVEEECKPKFKVGDKVKDKNNRVWFIVRVSETFFDISSVPNAQGYFVPIDNQDDYELVPQCFSNDIEMKRNACQKCVFAVRDDNPHCGLRGFTTSFNVEWCSAENDKAPNGFELQEDGYFSWVEKKKKYPKTYEECSIINGAEGRISLSIIGEFTKLINARNAYWRIAGKEMGLGKPWEPDYSGTFEHGTPIKYVIYNIGTHIVKERKSSPKHILSFPTEEMRDAFYEYFKEEIEKCKELL